MRVAKLAPITGKVGEEVERFLDRWLRGSWRNLSFRRSRMRPRLQSGSRCWI